MERRDLLKGMTLAVGAMAATTSITTPPAQAQVPGGRPGRNALVPMRPLDPDYHIPGQHPGLNRSREPPRDRFRTGWHDAVPVVGRGLECHRRHLCHGRRMDSLLMQPAQAVTRRTDRLGGMDDAFFGIIYGAVTVLSLSMCCKDRSGTQVAGFRALLRRGLRLASGPDVPGQGSSAPLARLQRGGRGVRRCRPDAARGPHWRGPDSRG